MDDTAKLINRAVAVVRISDRVLALIDDPIIDQMIARTGVTPNKEVDDWLICADALERAAAYLRQLANT